MSDHYQVLMDRHAGEEEAPVVARQIMQVLEAQGLVCRGEDFDGRTYQVGPRVLELYRRQEGEQVWQTLACNTVKVFTGPYVNQLGLSVFEWAQCPCCGERCGDQAEEELQEILDRIVECFEAFLEQRQLRPLLCSRCGKESRCDQWKMRPEMGFCHLAVEFWNWPPFDALGWQVDIPGLLRRSLGRQFLWGWGRL